MRGLRFATAMVALNVKAVLVHRVSFALQLSLMFLNNLIYCVIWFLLFERVDELRGWRLPELLALYGGVALSFGVSAVLAGGVRQLARLIIDGDLDTFLTQPRPPLTKVALSRSYASGWGDLASGMVLLGLSGYATLANAPFLVIWIICGATIFTASFVLFHSLAFWFGECEELARQSANFLVTLSVYPQSIHGGVVRAILFTVLPAGFVGYLPVEELRDGRGLYAAVLVLAATIYATLAVAVFSRGLRRYSSGNRITMGQS